MIEPTCNHCGGNCKHCSGSITYNGKPGRPRLFCCKVCRNSRYDHSVPKVEHSTVSCKTCKGECTFCEGQVPVDAGGKTIRTYCCAICRESRARESRKAALASIPLEPCEQCKGECTHCDGLQASSRAKYCCDDCTRLARQDRALEMQHYLDTIWYNEAATKRILKGNHMEYLRKFYPPKPKNPEVPPSTPLTRAKR